MILKQSDIEVLKSISGVLENISGAILIVPHANPDGDAIGSAIGLANILQNAGFRVVVISPNSYPSFYNWLDCKTEILDAEKNKVASKKHFANAELLICVDFNEPSRVGPLQKAVEGFTGKKILIDHHPDPMYFCDYTISYPSYSSTAELVFDVVAGLGLTEYIDKPAAEALYTGIMADTGSFSHNTSGPNIYKVIAELLKSGIKPETIHANVYHNYSADRMRLLGYCLHEKMEVLPEYRTAFISITKDELEMFNFKPGDTEGFVNYPLSISGIIFSALFIEKEGLVKASFRSKGDFPANSFSKEHFGGGGHLNAAGGEAKLPLKEALSKFKQLLPGYLNQLLNVDS